MSKTTQFFDFSMAAERVYQGDCLSRVAFERRYSAAPDVKKLN